MKTAENKVTGYTVILAVMLALTPLTVTASDDLDVTMRMVTDDSDLTDSVVSNIELAEPLFGDQGENQGATEATEALEVIESAREFSEAVSDQTSDVQELIDNDLIDPDGLLDGAGDLLDGTGDLVDGVTDGTGDLVDGIVGGGGDLLNGTGDLLNGTLDGAGDLLNGTGDVLQNTTDSLLDGSSTGN